MIVVRALGPADVIVNGAAAPAELLWKKNLALLVYLARSPKRLRTREHLVGLLWADKPEKDARHSLNEAVRVLRQSTGGGLESDAAQVRVAPGAVELDTDALEAFAAAGDYNAAVGLVQGEFLEGFSVPGASEFDNWLVAERDHWRRRSVEVLAHRADQLLAVGDLVAANDTLRRARDLDWRPEVVVRPAMRGLALAGGRAGALALFEEVATRLKGELGAEPDAGPRGLGRRIRRGRTWGGPPTQAPGGCGGGACSRHRESRRRRRPRWRSCAARHHPKRPGGPSPRCCTPWRTSSRLSCSWMTRTGSIGSPCSRSQQRRVT